MGEPSGRLIVTPNRSSGHPVAFGNHDRADATASPVKQVKISDPWYYRPADFVNAASPSTACISGRPTACPRWRWSERVDPAQDVGERKTRAAI